IGVEDLAEMRRALGRRHRVAEHLNRLVAKVLDEAGGILRRCEAGERRHAGAGEETDHRHAEKAKAELPEHQSTSGLFRSSCGIAQCGACTVHIDGLPTRSCSMAISTVGAKKVTTIEGLAANGVLHKVQQAWIDNDVPQCGYCQSGMIMAVAGLLKTNAKPSD